MVRPFYQNIRLLILTIVMLLAWGFSSFQALPRQEDPELIARIAAVQTAFPGASAERVEALVTTVLEAELSEIEAIKVLESDSRVGFSTVLIELVDSVKHAQPIWAKVRDEMDDAAAQFPPGVATPELEESFVKAYTAIASLTWNLPGEPNYAVLRRYAEELGVIMRGINGTEEVEFFGAPDEEVVVEIDAPTLVGVGLSPQQLARQISLSDAKVTAGQLRSPEQDLAIEVESELETIEQIRQLPVQFSSGQFTRLSDIARVRRGVRHPLSDQVLVSGKPAVVLGVMMESGLRIDQWAAMVHQELAAFSDRLPQGVSLDLIFDQSQYVENRISTLIMNLLFGATLVLLVAFVGMGWRSALVVGLALPFTIFAVLGWMTVFGVAIHQMSVTGLIIALGLLIDNAVVVVDEIQVEMQHGEAPLPAVIKTVKYLQVPLLASTLTTVLTFLPIYLLPGPAGEFVGSIALSVILSLVSSLAISLTVIAALAGRMLSSSNRDYDEALQHERRSLLDRSILFLMKPGAWWSDGFSSPRLGRFYRWSIGRVIARPLLGVALTMAVPLIGFIAVGTLEEQFFPLVNRDQFQIEVEFAPQTAIAQTRNQVLLARDRILEHEEVQDIHWFIGESAPKFYYNLTGNRRNQAHYAQAMVQLKSEQNVEGIVQAIQAELDPVFPSARVIVQQLQQGPPYDAPVEMRIYGPDIETLRRFGRDVRAILTAIPDVVQVRDDLTEARPKLGLKVDNEQVQQAGLNNTELAQQLEAYSEGVTGGAILESTENLTVRVRLPNSDRASFDQLASLDLRPDQAQDHGFLPTSALGEFELFAENANIARRDEQRVNTVQAYITAVGNLVLYVPLIVLFMITALVLSLGSFRQAGIVAVVAIGSVGMALFSLRAFGSVLGFMAIVGTMGLVGIAINGAIIVLAAFNEDSKARQGDPRAVQDVVVKATRHVLTTTITTMVGFTPLLMDGDPFWQPLAIAIAGGIGGSPFLALYFTPAAYLLLKRRNVTPHQPHPLKNDDSTSLENVTA